MQETTSQKPFLFDRSFDAGALKAAEEKKAAPSFTEQELSHAREQSYGQGFVAGKEAALRELQQQQATLLGRIQEHIDILGKDVWMIVAGQKQAAIDIAMSIVRKMVPDLVRKSGPQEILSAVESTVAEMINEPRLVLRINETHFDFVNREVSAMTQRLGYGGKMIILSDNNLGENDCRLEWADGGMERSVEGTLNVIEKQAARHAMHVRPPTPLHTDANQPHPETTDTTV